jgi:hypothetical protein
MQKKWPPAEALISGQFCQAADITRGSRIAKVNLTGIGLLTNDL